jgi:hypothetical protein
LLQPQDVAAPLLPYAAFISSHERLLSPIIREQNYLNVRDFLARLLEPRESD